MRTPTNFTEAPQGEATAAYEGTPRIESENPASGWLSVTTGNPQGLVWFNEARTPTCLYRSTADFTWQLVLPARQWHSSRALVRFVRPADDRMSDLIHFARDEAGLSISELAQLISVSRRSLYHWLEGASVSSPNRARLQELVDVLRPMVATWGRERTAGWIAEFIGETHGRTDTLATAVDDALAADRILTRPAPRWEPLEAYELPELSREELRFGLAEFVRARSVVDHRTWEPPELVDSVDDNFDDEDG